MKTAKRFLPVLLAVAILLCFAGCSSAQPGGDDVSVDDFPDVDYRDDVSPEDDFPEDVSPEDFSDDDSQDDDSHEDDFPEDDSQDDDSMDDDSQEDIVEVSPGIDSDNALITDNTDTDADDFGFSDLDGVEFWFGSGVGAWSTIVTIRSDGTFTGYFHDSDMGDSGPGYPGGVKYECFFRGRFSSLRKSGDHEYSMICESLSAKGTVGEEKIVDGIMLITSTPYGFDNAYEFSLYLPGKKAEELPELFLDWSHDKVSDGVLTCYGLFNVVDEFGFIVW